MTHEKIPLSHPQRRVWLTELMYPGTGVGNLAGCAHFPGDDAGLERLRRAIHAVVERHDALRLRLIKGADLICAQYFGDPLQLEIPVVEIGADRAPLLEESKRPFALYDQPLVLFWLLKLPEGRIGYFFKYHHINVDALTVSLLNREIFGHWRGDEAPPEAPSFREFLARERAYLDSEARAEDEAFWRDHLAGLDAALSVDRHPAPSAIPEGARSAIETRRYEHELSAALSAEIVAYCKDHQTTVFRFFLSVFALYFAGNRLDRDVVLATGHHNRLTPREKSMVGMTVSTLPMRFSLPADLSFEAFTRRVHATSKACLSRQEYPYDLLSRRLRAEGYDPKQLLRWILNHIPSFDGDYVVERYSPGADLDEINIKINPNQRPRSAPLQLGIDAQMARYDEAAVRRIFEEVERIIHAGLEAPTRSLRALTHALQAARGLPESPPRQPRPRGYSDLLAEAAERFAERVAVVDEGGARTYARLWREVGALRGALIARGVRLGDRVALITDRRAGALIGALAVLTHHAAYVPITPDTPPARMRGILEDAGVTLALTDTDAAPPALGIPCIDLTAHLEGPPGAFEPVDDPEALAYCIYTSGSSGAPKGVMAPQRGLINQCLWWNERLELGPEDAVAAFANLMFDVSVVELLPPLLRGAAIHVMPEAARGAVGDIARFFDERQITAAILPTKVGELFQAHARPATLRILVLAGEQLRPVDAPRDYRLINAYGPTEASVLATTYEARGDEAEIPIGVAAPNTWAYVVDDADKLAAPGEAGELLLAGDQIALGYINDPERTREAFIPNPFARGAHDAVAYRTGDIARVREDGQLVFIGRRDRQIKLRGFRVEPGEIERCLLGEPAVTRCRVILEGGRALIAYCAREGGVDDARLEASLRQRAHDQLPAFMRPDEFVLADALPLNGRGKVDEAALSGLRGEAARAPSRAPRDPLERRLLEIFRGVLGDPALGVTDSFFERGGDSISAMRLFAEIEASTGRALPASLIFQRPSAAALAEALRDDAPLIDNVASLRAGGGPQLICVHDFSGDLLSYTYLVGHLPRGYTIHGLRWDPRIGAEVDAFEGLAARYLRAARAAQPRGPYHLLGYSIGGAIAYEMARQLRAAGEEVAFLGLVDTVNFVKDRQFIEAWSVVALRWGLSWLRGMKLSYKLSYLAAAAGRRPSLRKIKRLLAAQRQMRAMAMRYAPGPIDRDLTLFKATQTPFDAGEGLGWAALARGVEVLEFDCDHALIMNEARAARIARRIEAALEHRSPT